MTKLADFESLYTNDLTNVSGGSGDQDRQHLEGGDKHVFPSMTFDEPQARNAKEIEITYTADDLAKAVEKACKTTALEVERQTRAVLVAEIDYRQAETLEAIRDQLGQSEEVMRNWISETITMTQSLAKFMGQAVVPKALALQPFADIADMIREILPRLAKQPLVEVRLASELVEQTDELLGSIVEETGFSGELKTIADSKLNPGDARLVWKNGVADRCLERIQKEANTIVDTWLGDQPIDRTPANDADSGTVLLARGETMPKPAVIEHQSSEERPTS